MSDQGTVAGIFIAPQARATMAAVDSVSAVAGRALEGDRYFLGVGSFSRWPGEGRAVTLIEAETIDAILNESKIDLTRGEHRRNIVTRGVRLESLLGRKFRVGGATLRGSRLCAPCAHLQRLAGPGTFDALRGRGGLRAEILESGTIGVGDAIAPMDAQSSSVPRVTPS